MGLRVLVTRPEPGAGRTAARLQAAGFEPIVLPLSEIVRLAPALPATATRRGRRLQRQCGAPGAGRAAVAAGRASRSSPSATRRRRRRVRPASRMSGQQRRQCRRSGARYHRSRAGRSARIAYLCGRVRLDALEAELGARRASRSWSSRPTIHAERAAVAGGAGGARPPRRRRGAGLFGEGRAIACTAGGAACGNDLSPTPRSSASRSASPKSCRNVASGSVLCRRDAG